MAYLNGFSGNIQFASATLQVTEWTLNMNGEAVDTTNTGDSGWESNILGAKSWDGTAKSFWDGSAVPTGTPGLTPGARGTVTLTAGSSGKTYTGTAQLTQCAIGNPVKGAISFDITFKGSGALTMAS